MGLNLYIVLVVLQLSSVLATGQIPLKCFVRDNLSVFGKSSCVEDSNTKKNNYFGTVEGGSGGFNKDGCVLEAENIKYYGLDDAILDDFGFNFTSKVVQLTFHSDYLVTFDYKSSGYLFSLPVYGQGFAEVTLKNCQIAFIIPFEIQEANNKKFVELKSFEYWFDIRDKSEFKFMAPNQDKELCDAVHKQLNQNWKFVMSHFGKAFKDGFAEKVFNIFKDYFKALPLKDFDKC